MKPLIDKRPLLEKITSKYDVEEGEKVSSATIYNMILNAPEVKRRQGYWFSSMDGDGHTCSWCGHDFCYLQYIDERPEWKFCPNCGAEMEVNDD